MMLESKVTCCNAGVSKIVRILVRSYNFKKLTVLHNIKVFFKLCIEKLSRSFGFAQRKHIAVIALKENN